MHGTLSHLRSSLPPPFCQHLPENLCLRMIFPPPFFFLRCDREQGGRMFVPSGRSYVRFSFSFHHMDQLSVSFRVRYLRQRFPFLTVLLQQLPAHWPSIRREVYGRPSFFPPLITYGWHSSFFFRGQSCVESILGSDRRPKAPRHVSPPPVHAPPPFSRNAGPERQYGTFFSKHVRLNVLPSPLFSCGNHLLFSLWQVPFFR